MLTIRGLSNFTKNIYGKIGLFTADGFPSMMHPEVAVL